MGQLGKGWLGLMRVVIWNSQMYRAKVLSRALAHGFSNLRIEYVEIDSRQYWRGRVEGDACVMYGLPMQNRPVWDAYKLAGIPRVLVDMGYFMRLDGGGRYKGYHRFCVDDYHPEKFIQGLDQKGNRWRACAHEIGFKERWGTNAKGILVAGMQGKTAHLHGFEPGEWERWMVEQIRERTDEKIVYRPKPSDRNPPALDGLKMYMNDVAPARLLSGVRVVATHHSNIALEAIACGTPFYCEQGAAQPLSMTLDELTDPPHRLQAERLNILHNACHLQYSVAEIHSGFAWKSLMNMGVVPCR